MRSQELKVAKSVCCEPSVQHACTSGLRYSAAPARCRCGQGNEQCKPPAETITHSGRFSVGTPSFSVRAARVLREAQLSRLANRPRTTQRLRSKLKPRQVAAAAARCSLVKCLKTDQASCWCNRAGQHCSIYQLTPWPHRSRIVLRNRARSDELTATAGQNIRS